MKKINVAIEKREFVKAIIGWTVGGCVGFVVTSIIKGAIEPENRKEAIKLYIGAAAISMVAKESVQKSINDKVDMVADAFKNAKMEQGLKSILDEAETESVEEGGEDI